MIPLAGKSAEEKVAILKATSYRDYLIGIWGASEEVANCFQGRTLGFFGLGCDAVAAAEARALGYPGFQGLGLPPLVRTSEPYIYHFPDGNASLARLLVRSLIPEISPGHTMDDVVLAPFDYGKLDRDTQRVRIRLDSTCIDVRNAGDEVLVGYARAGMLHRVAATHAVLACFHCAIPHIMPELPASAARRTRHEHQDAYRLQQRAHTQLARLAAAGRARHLGADVVPQPRQARLSRKHRRLSPCARSGRAHVPAPGSRTGRAQPGARCTHAVPYRPGEAARNDVRRFRGENSR